MFDIVLCQRDFEEINNIQQSVFQVERWDSDDQLKDHLKNKKKVLLITDKSTVKPDLFNIYQLEKTENTHFFFYSDEPHNKDGFFPEVSNLDICADYYEDSGVFLVVNEEFSGINTFSKEIMFSINSYTNFDDYKKALFLDRDGVINVDKAYVHKKEDLEFVDGVIDFLKDDDVKEFEYCVVTNQAGVARGYFDVEAVSSFNEEIKSRLASNDIYFKNIEISPYHFDKGVNEFKEHSLTRKPFPGMILKTMFKFPIDLSKSFIIGDKVSDDIDIDLLRCIHISGNYDLSDARSPVVKTYDELKNLLLNS
jgi:D,D-heptose 1,7-bisphosphate phosphatase